MSEDTLSSVVDILRGILSDAPADIDEDSKLAEDLGADSFDALEVIVAIEEEFGVEIDAESSSGIKTVGDLVKVIESLSE